MSYWPHATRRRINESIFAWASCSGEEGGSFFTTFDRIGIGVLIGLGQRLLIVDDDRHFAAEIKMDAERLGLDVRLVHATSSFEQELVSWSPTIIAMDLVMPGSDGLDLIRICGRLKYQGALILMSGGFELYLKMAEEIAMNDGLHVAAKLPKPFRPKQFTYILMSLL